MAPDSRAVRDRGKERTRTPSTSVQPSTVAATNTKAQARCAFVHVLVGPPVKRIIVADRVQLVDRLSAAVLLADVEPEGGVRGKPLGVHGFKDRGERVDVVVNFEIMLVVVCSQDATDVLNDAAFERKREGKEDRKSVV